MLNKLDAQEKELFKRYAERLSEDGRRLAESLYSDWIDLGVAKEMRQDRIDKLNAIILRFFGEIKEETEGLLLQLKKAIKGLEQESETLGRYLSMTIDVSGCGIDQPLHIRKRMLEETLTSYRQQVTERKAQITRLREWQEDVCRSLGVQPAEIREEPLLSEAEVSKLNARLEQLQKERTKRFETFRFKKEDIKQLMGELNLAPSNEFERKMLLSDSSLFILTDANLARLMKMHETLAMKLQETKNMVMELREQLHILWERLEEDQVYRANFLDANPGHSMETIKALREEIARCEEKKRQNLKMFIAKLRTDISKMWDLCLFGEEERGSFNEFYSEFCSEALLDVHEEYYRGLLHFYNDNLNIFKLYDERSMLWRKMQEIEARGAEPSRLNNRGGQLLKEERERKAIANKLPKIEGELCNLMKDYEARTGKIFMANDQPLIKVFEEQWEQRKQERQLKLSSRKNKGGGLTPTTTLPNPKISPLGKRNQTARNTPVPSKKPAMTMSASRAYITQNTSNLVKRSAVTSIKKHNTSPRQTSRIEGPNGVARRRLRLSKDRVDNDTSKSNVKAGPTFKAPAITVNGNILKKKKRLSGKLKNHRRSSRHSSRSSGALPSSEEDSVTHESNINKKIGPNSTMMTSYSEFQEHLNENVAARSSIVPERVLRAKKDHQDKHNEQSNNVASKSNLKSPMKVSRAVTPRKGKENFLAAETVTPKTNLQVSNVFGITPTNMRFTRGNTQVISKTPNANAPHIDHLTPRPKQTNPRDNKGAKNCSFLPLRRQNTVTVFSPLRSAEKPLLRSSSSHNLGTKYGDVDRCTPYSPSHAKSQPKLQLAKKLPLII